MKRAWNSAYVPGKDPLVHCGCVHVHTYNLKSKKTFSPYQRKRGHLIYMTDVISIFTISYKTNCILPIVYVRNWSSESKIDSWRNHSENENADLVFSDSSFWFCDFVMYDSFLYSSNFFLLIKLIYKNRLLKKYIYIYIYTYYLPTCQLSETSLSNSLQGTT